MYKRQGGDLFLNFFALFFAIMEDRLIKFSNLFVVIIDSHVKPPFRLEAA